MTLAFQELTRSNLECIQRLQAAAEVSALPHVPKANQASVAAILFQASDGQLRVVMTTRALHLRSHPGQASLPGGRMDSTDKNVTSTALRESCEEVGLSSGSVVWLHTGAPFLSKTAMLVHPVVLYLKGGQRAVDKLVASPSEVSLIWSTPLAQFLTSTAPDDIVFAEPSSVDEHRAPQTAFRTFTDIPWIAGSYRLHRFRSAHQLIKGLTADVLIYVASIAYARKPAYQVAAADQKPWAEMVELVINNHGKDTQGNKRWGDGESGDAQGSSEAYETHIGIDD